MIVTYNWLKEFVDFDFSPEELSHRLTMAGLEVDAMEKIGADLDSVIVARLLSVEPHPDADRLTVCRLDTGSETVQVVCGAKNHKAGDLVALAQVGSVLPGDFKIKKSKIRGEVSMGMLCSETELALAKESQGILILPADLKLGRPVFSALGLKDVRFELGLTPNRPDCLSVYGVAREVAAMAKAPLKPLALEVPESGEPVSALARVDIEDAERCPRYAARLIRGVKIGPSPEWLVRRLESVGQRSINNVVDVTNYVLMELGHPLHAFDFNLLNERRIRVRCAEEGERFQTLDGQERLLSESDLMICDGKRPVALAGIMGGLNSEVNDRTRDILLESAYFSPVGIRRTGKRLGLHTEASHRFERGADIDMVICALDRAASLIAQLGEGSVAPGRIDAYPGTLKPRELRISTDACRRMLGMEFTTADIEALLLPIGCRILNRTQVHLTIGVPSFRPDLEREIDLIEEVARLGGYDNIPVTMPKGVLESELVPAHQKALGRIRKFMAAGGCNETISYSFISPTLFDALLLPRQDERRNTLAILNPLSEDQSVMRTSLVPSLLQTVARNLNYRLLDLRLFELRPVFRPRQGEELPVEKYRLVAALCGRRAPEGWAQSAELVDFFDLKGLFENLCTEMLVDCVDFEPGGEEPFLHPGKSCRLVQGGRLLGTLGEVHPDCLTAFDIDRPVYLMDLDVEALIASSREKVSFTPISRYPDVSRDSALLVDDAVSARRILDILAEAKVKDVEDIQIFDLYQGPGIAQGKKSIGVRVRYRSLEKTLKDEEVVRAHGKLIDSLCRQIGAEVR